MRSSRCAPPPPWHARRPSACGDDPIGDDLSRLEPAYLRAPRGVAQAAAGGS